MFAIDVEETTASHYRSFPNMPQEQETATWCRFSVHLAGKTSGAHLQFIEKFKKFKHAQVDKSEQHDYILVFCPVASRVQVDISEALDSLQNPANKPVILVVMHHHYNPGHVLADSSRQVKNPNVYLTVDCLFYEGEFLACKRNDDAWAEIRKCLGISEASTLPDNFFRWIGRHKYIVIFVSVMGIGVIICAIFAGLEKMKN